MCLPINGIGLVDVNGVLGGNSSLFCAAMNYAKLLNFEAKGIDWKGGIAEKLAKCDLSFLEGALK